MNNSWLDQNRNILFIILLAAALGGAIIFYRQQPAQQSIEIKPAEAQATATPAPTPTASPTPSPVRVYITGAVVNTDVYFLPQGSIIKDIIEAAGGLTPDADAEGINMAQELQDQQQIHVPRLGEENPPPPVQGGESTPGGPENGGETAPGQAALLNLNTATAEQLDSLPGIGPAIAQRIIDYRENNGGFQTVEEITQVSGIGQATFLKIKDLITVE